MTKSQNENLFSDTCYGSDFVVGDPYCSEDLLTGVSPRECARICLGREDAEYIILDNDGVDPTDYVGNCYCCTDVEGIELDDHAYVAALITCELKDF